MHDHPSSIKSKLSHAHLVSMGSALVILLLGMIVFEYQAFREHLEAEIRVQADMTGVNSAPAIMFGDQDAAFEVLSALRYSEAVQLVAVFLPNESLFTYWRRKAALSNTVLTTPRHSGIVFNMSGMSLTQEIHGPNGNRIGTLYIEASLEKLYYRLGTFALALSLAGALALVLGHFLLHRLARAITLPLSRLTGLMQQVSGKQDYALRANLETHDEIGALATGFNDMLTRIQQRDIALENELVRRKLAESRLAHLAHHDPVTGLNNRHFFNERLSQDVEIASSQNHGLCVMFIDLDNFKIVNDTLGHHIGDQLLQEAAQRLANSIRPQDIICRIGGDEFAIIMGNLHEAVTAEQTAASIIQALTSTFHLSGNEIFVGASIGYSFFPQDASDTSTLLRNADAAMYHAKERGKHNFQRYTEELENKARRRFMLENNLHRAMENEELLVYYQPQVDVDTGQITGFEALVRWHHPEMGMIAPAEFIQIAEDTGQIIPIGSWVLQTACLQAARWQKIHHTPLTLSVNLSSRQFKAPKAVENILLTIANSGMTPERVEVELTETTLMSHTESTIAKMELLRAAGLRIAIDDFGTGYSSMNYLKRFPIHTIKIDREFIQDIPENQDDITITRTIIAMAHTLKLQVVAEGVETAEQLEVLRKSGCNKAQGFLFGRPLSAEKAVQLLQQTLPPATVSVTTLLRRGKR